MSTIKADDLIAQFETMLREHWAYEWGAAKRGLVDCSGAFVYAYKQLGGPAIAHGSNSILRQSMGTLLPMSQAKPGYAAVKIRQDGGEPDRYKGDGIGNCYHIGLVGRDGNVLNAQSTATGFVSSKPAGWTGCAPLLAVDYTKGDMDMAGLYQATVNTASTSLNLRDAPDGKKTGSLPRGALVDVLDDGGEWWKVRYGGMEGYASAAYLNRVTAADSGESDNTITVSGDVTIIDSAGNTFKPVGGWRVLMGSVD